MNLKHLKITVILLILFGLFHSSCQLNEFDSSIIFEEFSQTEYNQEAVYCQSNPGNEIGKRTFERDAAGNIIRETNYSDDFPYRKITRTFSKGSQLNDSTFYYNKGNWFYEYSSKYLYERSNLTEIQRFNQDGTISHKTVYKYKNDKPLWEEFWYFSNNEWKFQYAHRFEFNRNGKLTKKESFQTEQKDKVYDTVLYTYYSNKLIEEKRITQTGATSYVSKFTYTLQRDFPMKRFRMEM